MKKRVLTLLAAALLGTTALHAQVQQSANDTIASSDTLQTSQNDSLRAAIDDTVYRLKDYKFAAGLKFGFNGGLVRLTDESYEMYKRGLVPGAIIRGYFQWRTALGLSLVPEVGYVGRGGLLTWEDVSYKQLVHCLDVRLAVRYNFDIKDKGLSPYVVVAPVWNIALGGKVDNAMLTESISVEAQTADASSLLNVYKTFAKLRNTYPALAEGEMLEHGTYNSSNGSFGSIACWYMQKDGQKLLVVHNTAASTKSLAFTADNLSKPVALLGEATIQGQTLNLGANSSVVFEL